MTPVDIAISIGIFLGGAVFGIIVGFFGLRARLPPWVRTLMGGRNMAMIFTRGGTIRIVGLEFKAPGIAVARGMAHIVIVPPGTRPYHLEHGGVMYVAAEASTHYSYAHSALSGDSVFAVRVLPASCAQGDLGEPHCLDELARAVGQVSKELPVGPLVVSIAADRDALINHVVDTSAQLLSSALNATATMAQAQTKAESLILELAKLTKAQASSVLKWAVIIIIVVAIAFGILSVVMRGAP